MSSVGVNVWFLIRVVEGWERGEGFYKLPRMRSADMRLVPCVNIYYLLRATRVVYGVSRGLNRSGQNLPVDTRPDLHVKNP